MKDAAKILGLTPKTVYRMLRDGRLPGRQFGRVWRVDPKDLQR